MNQEYLGDGVYVQYDGYMTILITTNGYDTTNKIYLEPEILQAFEQYCQRVIHNKPN